MYNHQYNRIQSPVQPCTITNTTEYNHQYNRVQSPVQPYTITSTTVYNHEYNRVQSPVQPCTITSTTVYNHQYNRVQSRIQPCTITSTTVYNHQYNRIQSDKVRVFLRLNAVKSLFAEVGDPQYVDSLPRLRLRRCVNVLYPSLNDASSVCRGRASLTTSLVVGYIIPLDRDVAK